MISRFIYTILLALISPVLLWGLYRSRTNKPKFGSRWKEHFGFTPKLEHDKSGVIWVHAVSVGEVLASKKLIEKLANEYPEYQMLVTTTTSTGAEQVAKFEADVIHRYMPIDFCWCVRRFLKTIEPDFLLVIETEIWPNTFTLSLSSVFLQCLLTVDFLKNQRTTTRKYYHLFHQL